MGKTEHIKNPHIQNSDDRLSVIAESAQLGWWDWNIETGELVWSKESLDMFGLPAGTTMSYERFMQAIHSEDRERVNAAVRQALQSGDEYSTEMRAVWPDGSVHWVVSRGRVYFNKTGKAIRMSGAGMDITPLKETQEKLQRAQAEAKAQADNFVAVFDAVPAGAFFSNDRECKTMISNRAAYEMLRMPYGSNMSLSAAEAERPKFRVFENGRELKPHELPVQSAAITGEPVRDKELEIRFEDGSSVYEFGHAVPLFDDKGQVRGAVGAFMDVTDRKVVEQRLRAATERFQIALRNTPVTVFNQGLDLRYRWMYNPVPGYEVADILGKRDSEILERQGDAVKVEAIKTEVMRTGKIYQGELELYHWGRPRTFHVTIEPQRDAQNNIIGLTCASFDLTDRKKEEAERERLARQRQLALDAAKMAWWHFDASTGMCQWDEGFKDILGVSVTSMAGPEMFQSVDPRDRAEVETRFTAALNAADPKPFVAEYRMVRPDGGVRWVQAYAAPEVQGDGDSRRVVSVSGTVQDITERKSAEQALLQQHSRYEFVAEGSDVGFWFCDLPFDKVIWDKRVKRHFWLPEDDSPVTMEFFYSLLHPEDREPTRRAIENSINNNQQYDVEYRTMAPDGRYRWVRANGRTFYDEAGTPVRFDGITQDITARKQAEEAVRQSHWRIRQLVDSNIIPIVRANMSGIIEANDAFLKLVGMTREELERGEVSWFRMTPEEYLAKDYEAIEEMKRCGFCGPFEKELIAKDGRRIPILNGAALTQQSPVEWQRFVVDLTEQKRAQAELEAAKKLLEVRVEERTHELQERTAEATMASEGLRELSSRLLAIQDEERRHIARELHDSAGQILTAIGLELAVIRDLARKDAPDLARQTEGVENLVRQLHSEIRTTSYLLHPPLLDEAGLFSALAWYARGITDRSGIVVNLEMAPNFGRLPRDTELLVFRLLQESLTNIHRHSESKTAQIRVTRANGMVTVEVHDQGKGMPPAKLTAVQSGGSGVGIRGMRERLRQLRGELRIASGPSGTSVYATIPIPEDELWQERGAEPQRAVM